MQSSSFYSVKYEWKDPMTGAPSPVLAGQMCPKYKHILAYSPDKHGRCLSGPLSCVSMNTRLMITDFQGKPEAVLEVLGESYVPYMGSITSLAVHIDVGKIWACGREKEESPFRLMTFSYWVTQMMTQAFDIGGISAIRMLKSEPLPSKLKKGDHCMLSVEPQPNALYRAKLWVSTISMDPSKDAKNGVKAVAIEMVRENDPASHVTCNGDSCNAFVIPGGAGGQAGTGVFGSLFGRRLDAASTADVANTVNAAGANALRRRATEANMQPCSACTVEGLDACGHRMFLVGSEGTDPTQFEAPSVTTQRRLQLQTSGSSAPSPDPEALRVCSGGRELFSTELCAGAACNSKELKLLCFDHDERTWVVVKQGGSPSSYELRCCDPIPVGDAIHLPDQCSSWCAKLTFTKGSRVPNPTEKVTQLFTPQGLQHASHFAGSHGRRLATTNSGCANGRMEVNAHWIASRAASSELDASQKAAFSAYEARQDLHWTPLKRVVVMAPQNRSVLVFGLPQVDSDREVPAPAYH